MWLDLCPNPSDVSLFTTGAYARRGGERGFRAVEEVMRVTRVQLVDHWNVNEPLMCFWLSSPLCSQQDLSYLVLWTVGFQWERLEGSNGDSGVHFLIVQIRCDVRFTRTRLAVFPLYFLISKPGNRERSVCADRPVQKISLFHALTLTPPHSASTIDWISIREKPVSLWWTAGP